MTKAQRRQHLLQECDRGFGEGYHYQVVTPQEREFASSLPDMRVAELTRLYEEQVKLSNRHQSMPAGRAARLKLSLIHKELNYRGYDSCRVWKRGNVIPAYPVEGITSRRIGRG